ncbi:MAG: DUF3488 and transglutaminase-like domain-containing protein [Nitrospira sp.]
MPFNQALRLASILLASAAFIGLALGATLPEWLVLLTGGALVLTLLRALHLEKIEPLLTRARLSQTAWNILVVVAFVGFWADLLWISGDLLPAGVHFLLLLLVIKLSNLDQRRDYLHLYAISLMAILGSAAHTTDLWYVPVFLAYLVTGVWALLLFQLTKEPIERPVGDNAGPVSSIGGPDGGRITRQVFWMANGLAMGTLGLTVLIFFTIPRISAGIGHRGGESGLRTSGFSETVNLGMIGPIKQDPGIVMRVELLDRVGREPDRFYLRGMAYDRYDGKSWTTRLSHRRQLSEYPSGTFTIRPPASRTPRSFGPTVRQRILLEVLDTPVLFAAPQPEAISGEFLAIQSDPTGAIYLPFPASSRIEYSVVSRSNLIQSGDMQAQSVVYTETFGRHFLQMPDFADRVAALGRNIADGKASAYEKAQAIEAYLTKNYRYSLEIPAGVQANPLEEFLFTRKTGYCEHYATAMVMLLRSVGVPARLVTGFLATEWNEYGNYFLVRQRDAHAWVEVHLPNSGWITMDPTPAVSEPVDQPGWFALGRVLDTLRLRWNRFFVQYTGADQLAMVRGLKEGTSIVRDYTWGSISSVLAPVGDLFGRAMIRVTERNTRLLTGFASSVVLGIGLLLWLVQRRPWRGWQPVRAETDASAIAQVYRQVATQIARQGIRKPDHVTPLEFARTVQQRWKEAGECVIPITDLYCRGRFGHEALTAKDMEVAYHHLKQLLLLAPPKLT